ncbi:MAG: methyl-accepting chemotaxis protein [Cyanobacteria bacterium P01_D01_bin.156]
MAPNTEFPTQLNNIPPSNNGLTEGLLESNGAKTLRPATENQYISNIPGRSSSGGFWQRLKLRNKVLALALSLGVLPVIGVGGVGYFFVEQRVRAQAAQAEQTTTNDVASFAAEFMNSRFQDLKTFSQLNTFTDPEVREAMTTEERNTFLRELDESSPIYDDIAVVDLTGKTYAVKSPDAIKADVSQNDWFLNVTETQQITWVQPRAPFAGRLDFVLVGAAPIFDKETGEMVYIVRVRLDVQELKRRVSEFAPENTEVGLIDANNQIFLTNNEEGEEINPILPELPNLVPWLEDREPQNTVLNVGEGGYLTAYAPIISNPDDPQLSWSAVSLIDTSTAFLASRQLLTTVLIGTGVTALLVALVATLIATRATRPLLQITQSVRRLGQGDFAARINTQGEDEIAQLGANINVMAGQIQTLLIKQEESVQQQITSQAQMERAEEERQRSEVLQRELVQLLNEMEEASNGNLTVRTELTAGEIGILGDVFNSIIENLRSIVVQVKQATGQVNTSIDQSEGAIQQLADEALAQMDEITNTLNSVEQMSHSIQEVASNARQAAEVAQLASNAAQNSGSAMDRTVESILDLRSTVAETGKKVKQLGEASQQISQVVSLINEIAMKTNLLAVNASIEAAHAGEEGQGFAVVASEVGQLAEQSAAATKEIEQIVKNIQMGTRDVVEAMERGTSQVVEGTQLVQETKQGLGQIVEVSQQIDLLLQSISKATVSQAETSQTVTQLMQQITEASKRTSDSSRQVAGTLQNTVAVARELESAVDQFKVQTDA